MAGLVSKILIGALAIGGSSTGAFLLHKHTKPKNVREQLEKEGQVILDVSKPPAENKDSKDWEEKVKNWDTNTPLVSFVGNTEQAQDKKIEALKDKCKNALDTPSGDNDYETNLGNARSYCTKSKESETSA